MATEKLAVAFSPAVQAIDWATSALAELDHLAKTFFEGRPATIFTEVDPRTKENVLKLKLVKPLPNMLNRKATEALLNSRHSFDQAIFAAHKLLNPGVSKSSNFPWAENPKDLEILLRNRKIDERLWSTIVFHEPYLESSSYAGGNNLIRNMATLANRKHDIGLSVHADVSSYVFPSMKAISINSFSIKGRNWDSITNEGELARWSGQVEISGSHRFLCHIIFKDPKFPEPVDAVLALTEFISKANVVVKSLERRCAEILS
jgi:hypothetical protein